MAKIIWDKKDLDLLKPFKSLINIKDDNNLPNDKVLLEVKDEDQDVISKILKNMKAQQSSYVFETKDGYVNLKATDIYFIESFGEMIVIHAKKHQQFESRLPLYQALLMLEQNQFIRTGKSYIVNLTKVLYIRTKLNAKLELELENGMRVDVMRSYVKSFKEALGIGGKS